MLEPTRFVILHHQTSEGEHWDLMIEHQGVLLTWQLPMSPLHPGALPMPARRIHDHRTLYLTYEGPISGSRGTVHRIESGQVRKMEEGIGLLRFSLEGTIVCGEFSLRKDPKSGWTFTRE